MGKILHTLYKFILQNNIFISLCAVGLSMETAVLFHNPFRAITFYTFIFFGTLFTYNMYYLKDKSHPFALWFTIVGFVGTSISYYLTDSMSMYHLIIIAVLSLFYILPGYIGYKSARNYLVFKLFILVIVWTHATFFLPNPTLPAQVETFTFYAYRFMLMWNLSLLFFIKDEEKKFNVLYIRWALGLSLFIQFIIATFIFFYFQFAVGLVFILISLLIILLSFIFIRHKKSQTDYLFFIDGIMILESIFVLLL